MNNENKIDKLLNENKNGENNGLTDEFSTTHKDRKKRKSWIEKSGSGVIQNINSKNTQKKYLPKIKYNTRKHSSMNNRQCDITFNSNNIINNNITNINVVNKINSKTLNINKLVINFKDRSPEKKCNLKSINHTRLPSANSSKLRESFPLCSASSNLNSKNLFYNKYGNNICIDDNNIQILNLNQNNLMRHSGRIVIKDLLNANEITNNLYNGSKSIQSSKNVTMNYKCGLKGMKMKKDNYFNVSNKITINAKNNEINKTSK